MGARRSCSKRRASHRLVRHGADLPVHDRPLHRLYDLVSATVPFPSVLSGVAGVILLWRRRNQITDAGFAGFLVVMALYVASVL